MKKILLCILVFVAAGYFVVMETETGQDLFLDRLLSVMTQNQQTAPVDGLDVYICGASSPLSTTGNAQSCVFIIAGDRSFVVDTGPGSPRVMRRLGLPLNNLEAVLLTHFHGDHISALGDVNFNSWVAGRGKKLTVMGPEGVDLVVNGFNQAYSLDSSYRTRHHGWDILPLDHSVMQSKTIEAGLVFEEDGLSIRAFRVDHSPIEPAVGYRFDYKGRSVAVSGDSIVTKDYREAVDGVDLLLADALSEVLVSKMSEALSANGNERTSKLIHDVLDYHASTTSLVEMAKQAKVRQLAFYHMVPMPTNAFTEKVFRRGVPQEVIITDDGTRFILPADSDEIVIQ